MRPSGPRPQHSAVTGHSPAHPAPKLPEPCSTSSPLPEAPAHAPNPSPSNSRLYPSPTAPHWGGPGLHSPLIKAPSPFPAPHPLREGMGPSPDSTRASQRGDSGLHSRGGPGLLPGLAVLHRGPAFHPSLGEGTMSNPGPAGPEWKTTGRASPPRTPPSGTA